MEPNLVQVCIVAFIAVMTLLLVMACAIAFLTRIFPVRKSGPDAAVLAAIHSAAAVAVPGSVVTSIIEEK